jgi:hypothetical protein
MAEYCQEELLNIARENGSVSLQNILREDEEKLNNGTAEFWEGKVKNE